MSVSNLDHCNIMTARLRETVEFYTDVLGMKEGPRPGTGPGAWLYDEHDAPVIHLIGVDPQDAEKSFAMTRGFFGELAPRQTSIEDLDGSGAINHLALRCNGYDVLLDKIRERGLPYRENVVESIRLRQIFIKDPNGILLECNFAAE